VDERVAGYASGILDIASGEDQLERVEDELFRIAQAFAQSDELRSTLTDPQLPSDRKQDVIDDLLGGRASSLTVGLVQFIVAQNRASELPAIAKAFVEQAAATRDLAVGEVRSAVPLDEATVARLAAALGKATGKRVEVKVIVDPSIIGGINARVGDTVIDGSIAGRFDALRQTVKSR